MCSLWMGFPAVYGMILIGVGEDGKEGCWGLMEGNGHKMAKSCL